MVLAFLLLMLGLLTGYYLRRKDDIQDIRDVLNDLDMAISDVAEQTEQNKRDILDITGPVRVRKRRSLLG